MLGALSGNLRDSLTPADLVRLSAAVTEFWGTYGEEHPADTAARHVHWQNVLDLDAKVRQEHYSKVDLSRGDVRMEEVLYACVVLDYFTMRPLAEPGQVITPPLYSPAQAGLRVFFERGSWYATWIKLEEPAFQPDSVRRQLFVIEMDPAGGIRFRDMSSA